MSVRATSRLTGASKGAILRLLVEAGTFAAFYQGRLFRGLRTTRVEADEVWSFCAAKQKNATQPGQGDLWTYCAIDSDSKLVFSWLVGARNGPNTDAFIADVASRLSGRIQLSTDGYGAYLTGVRRAFRFARVDYGQVAKTYASPIDPAAPGRYSPAVCIGCIRQRMIGRPDPALISTSYVESLHMTTRQRCRRFTRLTNAHSKSAANHAHAVALNFFVHNFVKVHHDPDEDGRSQDDAGNGGRAHGSGLDGWRPGRIARPGIRYNQIGPVPARS